MRLFLTYVLPFHWMTAFLLMAILVVSGPDGLGSLLGMMGVFSPADGMFPQSVSAIFATGFGLVAALFFWMLVTAATSSTDFPGPLDEISGVAFGVAVAMISALFLVAALRPVDGLFPAVALTVGGLAASYAAIHAERRSASLVVIVDGEDIRAAARLMAAGAAHASMLTRLSGRPDGGGRG